MSQETTPGHAVEYRPIAGIHPCPHNPRTHDDGQIDQIAASIREFGFTVPLLVDGEGELIAGEGRWRAAQRLGLAQVPVIALGHLSPAQRQAYRIADNQLGLTSGWDDALLAAALQDLAAAEFDLTLTAIHPDDLAALMAPPPADAGEPEAGDDDDAPLAPAGTMGVIGSYRFPIERQAYAGWLEALRQAVGFDKAAVIAEIRRRLGL